MSLLALVLGILATFAFVVLVCVGFVAAVLSVACEEPPNENETENPNEPHL